MNNFSSNKPPDQCLSRLEKEGDGNVPNEHINFLFSATGENITIGKELSAIDLLSQMLKSTMSCC